MIPNELFKVLSDVTRLRIVYLLRRHGELCVCELTEALQIIQPKISRHLAILRNSGLLKVRREGQWMFYSFEANLPDWSEQLLDALVLGCEKDQPFIDDNVALSKLSLLSANACSNCA